MPGGRAGCLTWTAPVATGGLPHWKVHPERPPDVGESVTGRQPKISLPARHPPRLANPPCAPCARHYSRPTPPPDKCEQYSGCGRASDAMARAARSGSRYAQGYGRRPGEKRWGSGELPACWRPRGGPGSGLTFSSPTYCAIPGFISVRAFGNSGFEGARRTG
jgi:hypothetical protein